MEPLSDSTLMRLLIAFMMQLPIWDILERYKWRRDHSTWSGQLTDWKWQSGWAFVAHYTHPMFDERLRMCTWRPPAIVYKGYDNKLVTWHGGSRSEIHGFNADLLIIDDISDELDNEERQRHLENILDFEGLSHIPVPPSSNPEQ